MAYILKKIGKVSNIPSYHFECDNNEDVLTIPLTGVPMSSTCYVINEGTTYTLNSEREWIITMRGGTGGGGSAASGDAVLYTEQELSEEQQMQARKNLGLYYTVDNREFIIEPQEIDIFNHDLKYSGIQRGDQIIVIWGDTEYECVVGAHMHTMETAAGYYVAYGDYPFTIIFSEDGNISVESRSYEYQYINFGIYKGTIEYFKINKEYLPFDGEKLEAEVAVIKDAIEPFDGVGKLDNGNYLLEPVELTFEAGSSTSNEEVSVVTGNDIEVLWGDEIYTGSFTHGYDYGSDTYIYKMWDFTEEVPFEINSESGHIKRKESTNELTITFAIGKPLPKIKKFDPAYLPVLSAPSDTDTGASGIVRGAEPGQEDFILYGDGTWGEPRIKTINDVNVYNLTTGLYFITGKIYFGGALDFYKDYGDVPHLCVIGRYDDDSGYFIELTDALEIYILDFNNQKYRIKPVVFDSTDHYFMNLNVLGNNGTVYEITVSDDGTLSAVAQSNT